MDVYRLVKIIYITFTSIELLISIGLLVLRYIFKIYTIDPYWLICMLLISSTLLLIVLISIKEDNENKENK